VVQKKLHHLLTAEVRCLGEGRYLLIEVGLVVAIEPVYLAHYFVEGPVVLRMIVLKVDLVFSVDYDLTPVL